jgi:hypothetical protein
MEELCRRVAVSPAGWARALQRFVDGSIEWIGICSASLALAHVLIGKPVCTFPEHALRAGKQGGAICCRPRRQARRARPRSPRSPPLQADSRSIRRSGLRSRCRARRAAGGSAAAGVGLAADARWQAGAPDGRARARCRGLAQGEPGDTFPRAQEGFQRPVQAAPPAAAGVRDIWHARAAWPQAPRSRIRDEDARGTPQGVQAQSRPPRHQVPRRLPRRSGSAKSTKRRQYRRNKRRLGTRRTPAARLRLAPSPFFNPYQASKTPDSSEAQNWPSWVTPWRVRR